MSPRSGLWLFTLSIVLTACGGGGDGGGAPATAQSTGTVVDAPVQGLRYNAMPSGLSGTTNPNGQFFYRSGDFVTFSYGQTMVGSVSGAPQITPWTMFGLQTPDPADNRWLNLARFVQTFNNVLPPVNPAITAVPPINFNQAPATFETDVNVLQLLGAAGGPPALVSAAQATANLQQQFAILGSWAVSIFGPPHLVVFTAMADGVYMLTENASTDPNGRDGMERGTYTWNPTTGAFTVVTAIDTNGTNGLSHSHPPLNVVINGDIMTFTDSVEPPVQLNRVIDNTDPIIGAWLFDQTAGPGTRIVLTMLSGGVFVVASNEGPLFPSGMERGTYVRNMVTGDTTFTTTLDTSGIGGVNDQPLGIPDTVNMLITGDIMTVCVGGTMPGCVGGDIVTGTRIRTP